MGAFLLAGRDFLLQSIEIGPYFLHRAVLKAIADFSDELNTCIDIVSFLCELNDILRKNIGQYCQELEQILSHYQIMRCAPSFYFSLVFAGFNRIV